MAEKEYIEREALCYQLEKQETIDGQPRAIRRARRIVEHFPAAGVRPVVRGRWLLLTKEEMENRGTFGFLWASDSWMNYECSECGEIVHNGLNDKVEHRTNFCPNCGADMREEQDGR